MMESCFNLKPERVESVIVDDLKKDLLADFFAIPSSSSDDLSVLSKEHLRVYLRIRPFTTSETDNGEAQECVTIEPPDTVLLKAPRISLSSRLSDKSVTQTAQRFQFSKVFGPETSQREIFDGTVKYLVRDVLEGDNSLVFTYGVTNAGKTFTFLGPDSDSGVLPRSLNVIFNSINGRIYTQMNIKPHRCRDFIKLTGDQLNEEIANKRNIMRLCKESDSQKNTSGQQSSCKTTFLEGSTMNSTDELADDDSISLDVDDHTKFSVWISFCEIYNENIHDLLEPVSNCSLKRTTLRLAQDVKGNSFVKDLKWIQVNDAEEANKVLKLGKKNQTFSCTKLNNLSSRSHCIFSIRIIRVEDVGIPRVHTISELSLCDLAGSERCAKTHNKGERLKEAGNINTSLLILGKCINALRHNQQSKLQQHVPFRESKLTHYLQSFFCGRGKACMIVNINQCASMFDETLNVLKFSAVAQKVVVLTSKPLPIVPKKSVREVSFIINSADQRQLAPKRKSSLVGWDMTLEDVQESEDESAEESAMEDTIQEEDEEEAEANADSVNAVLVEELKKRLDEAEREKLKLESRVREEVAQEYMELFANMEKDYNERLLKEKEIIEERAEKRMEIWKSLVSNMASDKSQVASLDDMIESLQDDLEKIKRDAEAAHTCLTSLPESDSAIASLEKRLAELTEELHSTHELLDLKTNELETVCHQTQQTKDELEEVRRNLESKTEKLQQLMAMCQEKDDMITKLQSMMDQQHEVTARDRSVIESIKEEILQLKSNCTCLNQEGKSPQKASRKRSGDFNNDLDVQPPLKKETREEDHCVTLAEISKLQNEYDRKDEELVQLRGRYEGLRAEMEVLNAGFEKNLAVKEKQVEELIQERASLADRAERLARDLKEQTDAHEDTKSSLGKEQKAREQLIKENEALVNEKSKQQEEVQRMTKRTEALECDLCEQKQKYSVVSEELKAAKAVLVERNNDTWNKTKVIESLKQEADRLKQELKKFEDQPVSGQCSHFHDTMDTLQKECEKVVKESAAKSQQIQDLKQDLSGLQQRAVEQEELSSELRGKLDELQEKFSAERNAAREMAKSHSELETKVQSFQQQVVLLEEQLKAARVEASKVADMEKQLTEKKTQVAALHVSLNEIQKKLEDTEASALQEARRREAERRRELLKVAEEAIAEKDAELERRAQEISRLKEEAGSGLEKLTSLRVELQRKEEDSADLKEKLADSKKQILQVQKEVESMREEEKSLRRKVTELEKARTQLLANLSSKEQTIHHLKSDQASGARSDEHLQLYQKACHDLQAKVEIIENMRLALKEQEDTQEEQDRVIEAQLDEIQSLNEELHKCKQKSPVQSKNKCEASRIVEECQMSPCKAVKQQMEKVCEKLKLSEEKLQADRKKWLEEKMLLINQAKQAEERRNQEMRKFVEDRERYTKMQIEMESLSKQLAAKEEDLLKWRKERDTLVSALEVQMKKLAASSAEKDKQLEQLTKQCSSLPQEVTENKVKELQHLLSKKESEIAALKGQLTVATEKRARKECEKSQSLTAIKEQTGMREEIPSKKRLDSCMLKEANSSTESCEEKEVAVLDSSDISSEGGAVSRFPKPELEIQFTPLQPNRVNVKRQGGDSVTVKITRTARKRKSGEMTDKDLVVNENRENSMRSSRKTTTCQKRSPATFSLARHTSQDTPELRTKKEGTLQKIGDFLQSSPTLLGSKAKKIMELVHSKSPEPEHGTAAGLRPKRSKRKLYKTEISSPLDIPSHPIIGLNEDDKETDHIIIKRRLRTRTAKKL